MMISGVCGPGYGQYHGHPDFEWYQVCQVVIVGDIWVSGPDWTYNEPTKWLHVFHWSLLGSCHKVGANIFDCQLLTDPRSMVCFICSLAMLRPTCFCLCYLWTPLPWQHSHLLGPQVPWHWWVPGWLPNGVTSMGWHRLPRLRLFNVKTFRWGIQDFSPKDFSSADI